MPQVNLLAERLRRKPAVVLGMNVSDGPKDARAVVAEQHVEHVTLLRAKRTMRAYGVTGLPTMVVLDREGVVREFWVGYSPTLAEDLLPIIEPLLD